MSEAPDLDPSSGDLHTGDTEEIDALPVLVESEAQRRSREPHALAVISRALSQIREAPGGRAAAMAAGGFVAGAAVVGLSARRREPRRGGIARPRRASASGPATELLQIVASRSLLVDVHLLGPARSTR